MARKSHPEGVSLNLSAGMTYPVHLHSGGAAGQYTTIPLVGSFSIYISEFNQTSTLKASYLGRLGMRHATSITNIEPEQQLLPV